MRSLKSLSVSASTSFSLSVSNSRRNTEGLEATSRFGIKLPFVKNGAKVSEQFRRRRRRNLGY